MIRCNTNNGMMNFLCLYRQKVCGCSRATTFVFHENIDTVFINEFSIQNDSK